MAVITKNQILAPFLSTKLKYITGQDPMGMLNIGEQVFSMLLPGLNNVTERIRYYSFYCWFFGWYAKDMGSEDPKELYKYIRRAEYLLALIASKADTRGTAGITEANKNYNKSDLEFSLSAGTGEKKDNFENTYWKNSRGVFGQNYVNSLNLVSLIKDRGEDSKLYQRTAFIKEGVVSGNDLELAFEKNLTQEAKDTFTQALIQDTVSQEALGLLGVSFNMKEVPLETEENKLLLKMLIGYDLPLKEPLTLYRKETTRLYLYLLKEKGDYLKEQEFLRHAYENQGVFKKKENETLTAWYYYQLSQYWHIVNTGCLSHVLQALHETSEGSWQDEERLIDTITSNVLSYFDTEIGNDTDIKFIDLPLLKENNNEITQSIHSNNYAEGLSYAFLLLKKLISENQSQIERLALYAKKHSLHSSSDFVAVFGQLETLSLLPIEEFIKKFLKKYVIDRHQLVAYNKVSATQTSEKFIREDGLIRFIEGVGFGFSNSRLNTLLDFYKELGVINLDGESLTNYGESLLKELDND